MASSCQKKPLIAEAISVEVIGRTSVPEEAIRPRQTELPPIPITTVSVYTADAWRQTPIFQRDRLQTSDSITGPALIIEATGTNMIEPGWQATVTDRKHLILKKLEIGAREQGLGVNSEQAIPSKIQNPKSKIPSPPPQTPSPPPSPDPVMLEIFNNLFMAIAEQMGFTLQKTSYSVNIKERLDFSCAIFDQQGYLVANAPHIPVHLGSMGESVRSLIEDCGDTLKPGDVYILNNPYNGGTHLPDVTVITPVFVETLPATSLQQTPIPLFYVASRGAPR